MLTVAVWWFWLQVMGLAALPLAYRFFKRLPGRGYALARPLGLLLSSYVLWMGGSFGLLRNSVGGALFSIGLVAAISLAVYWRGRGEDEEEMGLPAWLRANVRLVVAVEVLFAAALALWSLLRAYSPEFTTAGGEKFMEIMYLNSIGRSEFFPPHDAWLSGYAISYYYFGYVMMAMVTRLSGLAAHLTFNVGLASLFALTCTGAFGLVYDLVKKAEEVRASRARPIAWGFLGAVLVAVLGNLEGFLEMLYSAQVLPQGFWQWLDITEINQPFDPRAAVSLLPTRSGWWWWRASRVIHDLDPLGNSIGVQPIDEFPGFSFLLGDMHPHVLALPFVLLVLALALWALLEGSKTNPDPRNEGWWGPIRRLPLLVPLTLGGLAFLNTWDFPIFWLVFVVAYGLGRWGQYGRFGWPFLRDVGVTAATVVVGSFVLYLPFYVGFQSQAGGLLPTLYVGTRFRQYFVMYGPFLVAIGGLLVALVRRLGLLRRDLLRAWGGWMALILVGPMAVMLLLALLMLLTPAGRQTLESMRHFPPVYAVVGDDPWLQVLGRLLVVKLRTWLMPLVVGGMASLGIVVLLHSSRSEGGGAGTPVGMSARGDAALGNSARFALLCAVTGLLATLSVEFVYLVDNFGVRANTIFKFYFQAWVLMGIASAFAVYWLSRRLSAWRTAWQVAFWLLFAAGMVYPVLGNISRAGNFEPEPTLDGTAYLAEGQADDYAAINWLNENVTDAPVILEKPGTGGSAYVYEGRVAALTGLPTLLGWGGHEGQWRGSYTIQQSREPDILTIYNSPDPTVAQALLEAYGVTYVYVGPLERSEYEPRSLDKFARFMDVAYQGGSVTIYKMRE